MSASTRPPDHDHVVRRISTDHGPLDVKHFELTMGLVLDRLAAVEGGQLTEKQLSAAVGTGIAAAMANPATWCGAAEGVRKAAEQQAGSWLMGWFLRWLMRSLLLLGGGIVVYQLGGWTALAAVWSKLGGPR